MEHFLVLFRPNTKHSAIDGKLFSNFKEYFYSISTSSAWTVSISRQQQNIISISSLQIKNKIAISYTSCQNEAKPTI